MPSRIVQKRNIGTSILTPIAAYFSRIFLPTSGITFITTHPRGSIPVQIGHDPLQIRKVKYIRGFASRPSNVILQGREAVAADHFAARRHKAIKRFQRVGNEVRIGSIAVLQNVFDRRILANKTLEVAPQNFRAFGRAMTLHRPKIDSIQNKLNSKRLDEVFLLKQCFTFCSLPFLFWRGFRR